MSYDRLYIGHMLERIALILEFSQPGRDEFFRSKMMQEAIIRCLEILGEVANKVSDDLYKLHPDIPWSAMIALRNRILHGYDTVNLDIVWDVVENNIPPLSPRLEAIRDSLQE